MSVLTSSVLIQASAERVFGLMTNPQEVANLIPGLVRVTKTSSLPLRKRSTIDWEFVLLGIGLKGKWIVEELNSPYLYIAQTKGGVDGRLTYTILPQGDAARLTLDYDYQVPTS